ncbi:DNA glycosylase [Coniochaeta ligniaria NRRL 30616]|uniref:DNA-(apurinic or apyrimidinic site) lyase n=1 Tax=Coniochaeta ligniaria NRRL 30616 TaxID=1408157 RepID=A0A1J7JZQ2_9PEZI|nr:DNA glycosylase [Coniochaeta ligniaria NRRL 30616]
MTVGPRISEWRKLPLSLTELCIDTTLRCGQAFRWRKIDDEWHCTLQGRILSLKQDPTHLHYRATWPKQTAPLSPPPSTLPSPSPHQSLAPSTDQDDTLDLIKTYFNLHISLTTLYTSWSASDPNFARRAPSFTGIRILNQDAWEALVAFICSSNNNISRISQMAHKLCLHYGPYIGTLAGEPFHGFPGPEALAADGVEAKLRELGFGYRARYIAETARIVTTLKPKGWLGGLRNPLSPALGEVVFERARSLPQSDADASGYKAAHEALLSLAGVGPKVADCVCLMGLGWAEAVPVDTHVWQIAQRDYKFGGGKGKGKTFNKAVHDAVGDHFRGIWGEYAGWAQSVLFTANLKSFAEQAASGGKVEVETAVKVEQTEDVSLDLQSRMRVTKRKVVVKTEVKQENGDTLVADVKATGTRTSKRRRVQA